MLQGTSGKVSKAIKTSGLAVFSVALFVFGLMSVSPALALGTITEVTPVTSPTVNTEPSYAFNSSVGGKIAYLGDCFSPFQDATAGDNHITFSFTSNIVYGLHNNCFIWITDLLVDSTGAPITNQFHVSPFTIKHDITPPVITVPTSDVVESVVDPVDTVVNYVAPTAHDDFDNADTAVSCSKNSGDLFPVGTTQVTCTSEDSEQNSATATFNVVVRLTGPVLSEVTPVASPTDNHTPSYTFNSTREGAISYFGGCTSATAQATASDNTITFDSLSAGVYASCGLYVTDINGVASLDLSISPFTIKNNLVPPVFAAYADVTAEATSSVGAYVDYVLPTAHDDFDGVDTLVSCLPASGDLFSVGVTKVTCTTEDSEQNQATSSFNVTVQDTTAPVITAPVDQTFEATGRLTTPTLVSATATDAVDSAPVITSDLISFSVGTTTVTWTATDATGNSSTVTSLVIIQDTTAPTISISPSTQSIEANSILGSVASYTVTASDLVDGDLSRTASCSDVSGSVFKLGTTTTTCTVVDTQGNSSSATAVVNVLDTLDPTLTVPADQTFEATGILTSPTLVLATATDLVDAAPVITFSPTSSFVLGNNTVTWFARDFSNNLAIGTSKVIIQDTTKPVITLNGSDNVTLVAGNAYTEEGATTTDNYYTNIPVTIGGDVVNAGTVGTYHVTYDAVDGSNNQATTVVRTVTVINPSSGGFVAPAAPVAVISTNPIVVTGSSDSLVAKLTFSMQNADMVSVSEDPTFAGSSWMPYSANVNFTLSNANTDRKIYVKFRGVNGGETKTQEIVVPANSSSLFQAVLGVKITRSTELAAKLKVGSKGAQVAELQALLKKAGFFPAKQAATGYYGPVTSAAVKKYLASLK